MDVISSIKDAQGRIQDVMGLLDNDDRVAELDHVLDILERILYHINK